MPNHGGEDALPPRGLPLRPAGSFRSEEMTVLTKAELRGMIADDATGNFHRVAADRMTASDILLVITRSRAARGTESQKCKS